MLTDHIQLFRMNKCTFMRSRQPHQIRNKDWKQTQEKNPAKACESRNREKVTERKHKENTKNVHK